MSFEDKLNKRLLSEAPSRALATAQQNLRTRQPTGGLDDVQAAAAKRGISRKPQSPPDFAAVRKSMRRPMVSLDAAIHQIDQFLNTTQQDPSRLDSTVTEIEKAFNNIFEPLKAVRAGVADLRKASKAFNAEYTGEQAGQQPAQPAQQAQQAGQQAPGVSVEPGPGEDRFLNRIATDVELSNRQEDKLYAAKQGWEAYKQSGGKMNRGEFFRALARKLRLPDEVEARKPQPVDLPKRSLPPVGASKRYKPMGQRPGELQYRPTRTSPIESSAQRRKLVEAQDLGRLVPEFDEGRLINKIVTDIEMVNNPRDKESAFREGWLEYQGSGGRMNRNEFTKAVLSKLNRALPQQ